MKTTSIFVPSTLEVGTKEWHENRRNYITASECGAIMQLSPFTPAAKIFYLKLGLLSAEEIQNEAVHWGRQLEELIINDWQSHTGEEKSYLKKEKQREAQRIHGYYTTKEYPFLASTPDAIFSQFSLNILPDGNIERTPMSDYCPLEVKSISQWSASQWQAGIPPFYLCQITLQMICQNVHYGELCLLQDGRQLTIYPIHRSEELSTLIISKCIEFNDRITKARELMKDGVTEEVMAKIASLEPASEGTPAYLDFLKQKYRVEDKKRLASPEEGQIMLSYIRAMEIEKQGANSKLDMKAKLLRSMEDYQQINTPDIICIHKQSEEGREYFSVKQLKAKGA